MTQQSPVLAWDVWDHSNVMRHEQYTALALFDQNRPASKLQMLKPGLLAKPCVWLCMLPECLTQKKTQMPFRSQPVLARQKLRRTSADYSPPEELVMPKTFPRAPLPFLASLVAPLAWIYGRPDLFDSYSAGFVLLQLSGNPLNFFPFSLLFGICLNVDIVAFPRTLYDLSLDCSKTNSPLLTKDWAQIDDRQLMLVRPSRHFSPAFCERDTKLTLCLRIHLSHHVVELCMFRGSIGRPKVLLS